MLFKVARQGEGREVRFHISEGLNVNKDFKGEVLIRPMGHVPFREHNMLSRC